MSGTKAFTTVSRIGVKDAPEIIAYARKHVKDYQRAYRSLWQEVNHTGTGGLPEKRADLNTRYQKKYGLSKRTVNSLIGDVLGRFHAMEELKLYERNELCWKIDAITKKLEAAKTLADKLKPKAAANQATEKELAKYRKAKENIFYRKQKLNRMYHKLADLDRQIERHRCRVCFGTKKFFKAQFYLNENRLKNHNAWLKKFRAKRDSNIYYLGDSGETAGNQEFQLSPVSMEDGKKIIPGLFDVKIRTAKCSAAREAGKDYVTGQCSFPMDGYAAFLADNLLRKAPMPPREMKELPFDMLAEVLEQAKEDRVSVSYRLVVRGKKTYICASFEYTLRGKETEYVTNRKDGVVGLDFNSGHIQLSETDAKGNLVRLEKHRLRRHGDAMESDLREAVAHITKYCMASGKSLAIESLDFSRKKSKTTPAKSDGGKEYNRMLHTLTYSEFTEAVESSTYRNRVELVKVNPAYTTKIAKQKYCSQRKLVTHEGAAFVIARRAQGFIDKYIEPKKSKSRKEKKTA